MHPAKLRRKGIGHLVYAFVIIGIIIIVILVTVIFTRNQQLSNQAQAEITYFGNQQQFITSQSCPTLAINYQRAIHDASVYSSFAPSDFFQNLSNQYLSETNAKNCTSA
jgi:ABC-type antimicrobial peptide transport system permease subunit